MKYIALLPHYVEIYVYQYFEHLVVIMINERLLYTALGGDITSVTLLCLVTWPC